jgi:neutral amino acid transport system ATP-binding protein
MLEVKNLHGGYIKGCPILNGVDLTLEKSSKLAVFGQNGAGKSTLAKAIIGMLPYYTGQIKLNQNVISGSTSERINKGRIGFFWQGGRVFPHLTVYENIRFAAGKITSREMEESWNNICLASSSFESLQNVFHKQTATYLSGGQTHLLALSMILIQNPEFIILDEPSAGLSPNSINDLYLVLNDIHKSRKSTILLIEQNLDKAMSFCEKSIVLKGGTVACYVDLTNPSAYNEIESAMFD